LRAVQRHDPKGRAKRERASFEDARCLTGHMRRTGSGAALPKGRRPRFAIEYASDRLGINIWTFSFEAGRWGASVGRWIGHIMLLSHKWCIGAEERGDSDSRQ
jgi:hypothetical protein